MLSKFKIKDSEVEALFYGEEEDLNFPEGLQLELVEKDVKIDDSNSMLPILSAKNLRDRVFGGKKRTTDIILSENGINSFNDLKAAYFLVRYHKLDASKSVRDKIVQKYTEVLDYVTEPPTEEDGHR